MGRVEDRQLNEERKRRESTRVIDVTEIKKKNGFVLTLKTG